MTDEPRPDEQVRAEDAERVGNDAVERRAISVGNVVRNRRTQPDGNVPRAESRGFYRDLDGRRRIVGAGQVVPDGWTRLGAADVEERRLGSELAGVTAKAGDGNGTGDGDGPTLKELRKRASELEVRGASKMNRDALVAAIAEAEGRKAE